MSLRTWFNSWNDTTPAPTPSTSRRVRGGAPRRLWQSVTGAPFGPRDAVRRGPSNRFAEALEQRTMLTQLVGGQEFYFVQRRNDEALVHRIRLEGNIEVEIVGSAVDENNNISLTNLFGSIYSNDVFVEPSGGGLLPAAGSLLLGGLSLGVANPTINAIAAQNDGDVYAFNVIQL